MMSVKLRIGKIWSWAVLRRLIKPAGRYTPPTRIADDGTGFIVHADDKLTAFLELQKALDSSTDALERSTSSAVVSLRRFD